MSTETSHYESTAREKFLDAEGWRVVNETRWEQTKQVFDRLLPGLWLVLTEVSASQGVTLYPLYNHVELRTDTAHASVGTAIKLHDRGHFSFADDHSARDFRTSEMTTFRNFLVNKIGSGLFAPYLPASVARPQPPSAPAA